jgi:uncharacterized repeat protein (TIGR03803 family)
MKATELCSGGKKLFISLVITLVATASAQAAHEKILHDFTYVPQGEYPQASLIADAAGNLYGTTELGGRFGYGAIFELTRGKNDTWSENILYSFTNGADGGIPVAGLVFDKAGNLYGATIYGGAPTGYSGFGVVFELSPGKGGKWTENVLHSFAGYPNDGQKPFASLIFDGAGNLYGTTEDGGAYHGGTVFELTPGSNGIWTEKILYTFTGGADGGTPTASLIFDPAGNLYGTTQNGGNPGCPYYQGGCGTVFRLAPNGGGTWSETVLHSFNFTDGADPLSNLVFDKAGNLYGDTPEGPDLTCGGGGCGLVFRLTPNSDGSWTESIIYDFEGGSDGIEPVGGLILSAAGDLYGTTQYGGGSDSCRNGCGTVFELTPGSKGDWTEKEIHRFSMPAHGQNYGIYPVSSCS